MTDLTVLKDLLEFDNKIISVKNGRNFVRLKESDSSAKLKQIDLYDIPQDSILLNLDNCFDQPKKLFKDSKGQRQRCDYVLIAKIKNDNILVFIEIKSSLRNNKSVILNQFKGAECIIDYCDAVLNRFHAQKDFLKHFKKRFVIFYKGASIKKSLTRPNFIKNNDIPGRAYKHSNPINPSLKQLI